MAITATAGLTGTVADLFGGRRVLKRAIGEPEQMLEAVRKGLPYAAFEALREAVSLQAARLAQLAGIPPRTLARRRESRQLTADESDRLYRIARVVGLARETLGSLEHAREWLGRPNRSLSGSKPIDLLDTAIGTRLVEEALLRMEHGIHA